MKGIFNHVLIYDENKLDNSQNQEDRKFYGEWKGSHLDKSDDSNPEKDQFTSYIETIPKTYHNFKLIKIDDDGLIEIIACFVFPRFTKSEQNLLFAQDLSAGMMMLEVLGDSVTLYEVHKLTQG